MGRGGGCVLGSLCPAERSPASSPAWFPASNPSAGAKQQKFLGGWVCIPLGGSPARAEPGWKPCLPRGPWLGPLCGQRWLILPSPLGAGGGGGRGGQADEHGNLEGYSAVIISLNTERGGEGGEPAERGRPTGKGSVGRRFAPLHRHGKGAGRGQGEGWKG